MTLARRTLIDRAAECFGYRPAYSDTASVDQLLAEQTESAYTDADTARHDRQATAKNRDELAVQPGVLDVRGRILADVLYLEGLLTGARSHGLAQDLIERLEDVVDHGHELTVLLADTARATTIEPESTGR